METNRPVLLRALSGETLSRPPVWFMRQAGRYLAEYRAVRATAPDFVSFCLDADKAAEVTLQPMRRFPFDASIVFADILLIPGVLGQDVRFEAGEGPRLGPLPDLKAMAAKVEGAGEALKVVGETLKKVRAGLAPEKTLIGFSGAPWTVATYMLDGQATMDRSAVRQFAYDQPALVDGLLDILVESSAHYLKMQVDHGAQTLKIFESWAEGLSEPLFERLVIRPHQKLVARLRQLGVTVPIMGFPRGCGALSLKYAQSVDVQLVALDTACPLWVGQEIQKSRTIQGALDPLLLRAGGPELERRVGEYLEAWGAGPYVFNLGHGILPDVPVAHVEQVLKQVTGKDSIPLDQVDLQKLAGI